jgi:hypothetical protein|tara:strand:- start:412 stop:1065 length:654 start_codon:yes stop_codon:yes gene_type:complete
MQTSNDLGLRYMQIHISLESGKNLPGSKWVSSFTKVEFLSIIERTNQGFTCFALLNFDNPEVLSQSYEKLEIIEVISINFNSALVKIFLTGPIAGLFSNDLACWWVSPTHLTDNGMVLSLHGNKESFKILKNNFSELVGDGFSVKIGRETIKKPILSEILNAKQKFVLDKAIGMGYYNRPRECTQRDIASTLNLKQSTVCEHLQIAESKIFNLIDVR